MTTNCSSISDPVLLPVPFRSKPSSQADNMSPYLAMHMTCTCFTLVFSKPLGFPAIYLKKKKHTHHSHQHNEKKTFASKKRFSIYIKFLLNSRTLGHFFIKATLKVLTIVQTWNPRISKNRKEGDEGFERRTEKLTSGSMSWLQQISKCWTLNFGGFGGPLLRAGLLYVVSSSKVT